MRIDTAAGADVVDGTATPGWGAQAVLGEGADRFHGGPTSDQVNAGTGQPTSTSGSLTGRDDPARPGVLALDLGGGDDLFSTDAPGAPGSTYAGGPGRDHLTIGSRERRLALDLRTARLDVGGVVSPATGFEGAHLLARTVSLRGTNGPDSLRTTGCRQTIRGRAGRDVLGSDRSELRGLRFDCTSRADVLGGRGHDRLRGSKGPDRLLGGAGRDRAEGRGGKDLCRAERTRSCERR